MFGGCAGLLLPALNGKMGKKDGKSGVFFYQDIISRISAICHINKEKILRESNGFLLSKISYLSLRDGFIKCKDTKNAMKSIIICQIKCVRTNSIFMFLLGKCKRFVEQYQLFQITNN